MFVTYFLTKMERYESTPYLWQSKTILDLSKLFRTGPKKHLFTPEFYILNHFQTFVPVQNNLDVSKIKFKFSRKAKKIDEIFTVDLTLCTVDSGNSELGFVTNFVY